MVSGAWKKAQIHFTVHVQRTADFLAHTNAGQTLGALLHQIFSAGDVSAGAGNAAAHVLDHRADHQVAVRLYRLLCLHELSVAVVHHDDGIRIGTAHDLRQPADLRNGQRRTQRVATGALDVRHPRPLYGICHSVIVWRAVRQQRDLSVLYAEVLQRTALGITGQTDDALQRVVRSAGEGDHLVPCAQHAEQGDGQRMGAGHEVMAHQRILCAERLGEYLIQHFPALIAVAVARGAVETRLAHTALLKCCQHLGAIISGILFNALEICFAGILCLLRRPPAGADQWKKSLAALS